MDDCIKTTLETLTNCKLDTTQWIMSSLPIHCGGLGVRIKTETFLSSINSVFQLVKCMKTWKTLKRHGLSGYKNADRFSRHCEFLNVIKRALTSGDFNSILEPPVLCRAGRKRVDEMTLIP